MLLAMAGSTMASDLEMRTDDSLLLPSGNAAWLYDVILDDDSRQPGTWRYRFVVPALADRFADLGEEDFQEGITEEDMAELDSLGLDLGSPGTIEIDDSSLVTIGELEAEGAISGRQIIEFDLSEADDIPSVPADPSILLQDQDHADLVHLCESIVLPKVRALQTGHAPASIIISLSDRAVPFGEIDHKAVQLFEGFHPSRDNRACIWDPW